MRKMTIVGFGDSITLAMEVPAEKKWLNVLGGMLKQRHPDTEWNMINAGVGGNTSREGLARMEADVLAHRPDLVLVEFGGNDATHEPERHISHEEYEKNLHTIREAVQKTGARVVMVLFPPVVDEQHCWGKHPYFAPWGGLDGCAEEYRKITRRFAEQEQLAVVDIDSALRKAGREHSMANVIRPDGVHLTEEGNRVVAQTVFEVLLPILTT